MADAADSTPASSGQFALTVADLNTAVNHEPRVSHRKLASALGFTANHKFAHLIERHHEALERLGEVSSTVDETSRKGGRPGRTFWLNKRQALYLCTKSETPRATETTLAMVEVFDAHLAGRVAKPVAVAGHSRALPKAARKRSTAPAPAPTAGPPLIERDGIAVMRIGGETLVVDMGREQADAADRAVRLHQDGTITVGRVEVRALGAARPPRIAFAAAPHPAAEGSKFEALVRVLGVVVTSQPAATPRDDGPERTAKPRRDRGRLGRASVPPLLPDLGRVAVLGTA